MLLHIALAGSLLLSQTSAPLGPATLDTDGDGLSDRLEGLLGTDPALVDTDGDGLTDGYERAHALDPLHADGAGDRDGDGLSNLAEWTVGTAPDDGTDPAVLHVDPLDASMFASVAEALRSVPDREVVIVRLHRNGTPGIGGLFRPSDGTLLAVLPPHPPAGPGLGGPGTPPGLRPGPGGLSGGRARRKASPHDFVPPELVVVQPLDEAILDDPQPTIEVQYSDAGSGVDLDTLVIELDDADVTASFTVTPTGATWSVASPLSDGEHDLSVSICDQRGNVATVETSFTIDTMSRVITNVVPADGALVVGMPTLSADFVDDTLQPGLTQVSVSGTASADLTLEASYVGDEDGFSVGPLGSLPDGAYTLTIQVEDAVGNTATSVTTFSFFVDPLGDADGDGAANGDELMAGTDPFDPDTDDDEMDDGYELDHGLDPLVRDGHGDADSDGIGNWHEWALSSAADDGASPASIWVDVAAGGGGDGSSGAPYDNLQTALNAVPSTGAHVVRVAAGTYTGTVFTISGKDRVLVLGAGAGATILDGQNVRRVLRVTGSVTRCHFVGLSVCRANAGAFQAGGGVLVDAAGIAVVFDSCRIHDNFADGSGGGMLIMPNASTDSRLVNCLIDGNDADWSGGGLRAEFPMSIWNCTFIDNRCVNGSSTLGAGVLGASVLVNCIVRDNQGTNQLQQSVASYSNISGGYSGTGNVDMDPLFIGTAELPANSPAIDLGTDLPVTWDAFGDVRPEGAGHDLGWDEYSP